MSIYGLRHLYLLSAKGIESEERGRMGQGLKEIASAIVLQERGLRQISKVVAR